MTNEEASSFAGRDAVMAARILAIDPHAIGGVWIKSRDRLSSEQWLDYLRDCLQTPDSTLKLPLHADSRQLTGGLDLSATLATGHAAYEAGFLARAHGKVIILPNAEAVAKPVVSALARTLDSGDAGSAADDSHRREAAAFGIVACDESDGQADCAALRERLAIELDFNAIKKLPIDRQCMKVADIEAVREMSRSIVLHDDVFGAVVATCDALGVDSARIPLHALRVARICAALDGRQEISTDDLGFAARVVIAPRATKVPAEAEQEPEPPQNDLGDSQDRDTEKDSEQEHEQKLEDMLIEMTKAVLPEKLLAELHSGLQQHQKRNGGMGRSGSIQRSVNHGRRLGARRGRPSRGSLLDVIETLRAAAPWQIVRRRETAGRPQIEYGRSRRIEVRSSDFRVRTFKHKRETVTIFVVDASGSAALHRLNEAKGAIELLLVDCYARRDHVALISFRDKQAELMLPVTRSLTRVKRNVAALPGGGGTPLATAADAASSLASAEANKGRTPTLVFLTDGKANIDRNGAVSRERAFEQALGAARTLRSSKYATLVIDTSVRPAAQSRQFATEMGAIYLPLPYAGAPALSATLKALR